MKRFFSKDKILRVLGLVGFVFVFAGCKGPQNLEATKVGYKLEFVQPANGSLVAKLENGTEVKSGDSFNEGTNILFTATPNKDYAVEKWENAEATNGDKTQAKLTIGKTDVKVKVSFVKIQKPATDGVVTFSAGEHGKVQATVNGAEIKSGELQKASTEIVFTAIPDDGYMVASWEPVDAVKFKSTDTKLEGTHTVTGDIIIKVNFKQKPELTITFSKDTSVPQEVIIKATAGESSTAREIKSGDKIKVGERIQFEATGFDETKYKVFWKVTRGGQPLRADLPRKTVPFDGSYTQDGRDIAATLHLLEANLVDSKDKTSVTVVGKTGLENMQPQPLYIKLLHNEFDSTVVTKCCDVTSWFKNLPKGLSVKADCNESNTLTENNQKLKVLFFGVPTEPTIKTSEKFIEVVIPQNCIKDGKSDIKAIIRNTVKYDITEGPKFTTGEINISSEDTSVTLTPSAKIEVKYNHSAKKYVIEILDALNGITDDKTHTVNCVFRNGSNEFSASGRWISKTGMTIRTMADKIEDAAITAEITITKK